MEGNQRTGKMMEEKTSHVIASEDCDSGTTQELDLLNLDLDDGDFVEFLVEWGSNSPMTDGSVDIPIQIGKETTTKTRNGGSKRKNVMVVTESSTSDQPKKRSKKSSKQSHSSGGSDGISVLSSSSVFRLVTTETAECSAHMAAAGTYNMSHQTRTLVKSLNPFLYHTPLLS